MTDNPKDLIISRIEQECGEITFSDEVVEVLKKLTKVDLFTLNMAFYQVFVSGQESERDREPSSRERPW